MRVQPAAARPANQQRDLGRPGGRRCSRRSRPTTRRSATTIRTARSWVARKSPFRYIPNGIPGLETRLPLLFSEGVRTGRITLNQFVALTRHQPGANLRPVSAQGHDRDRRATPTWRSGTRTSEVTITNGTLHHACRLHAVRRHARDGLAGDDAGARRARLARGAVLRASRATANSCPAAAGDGKAAVTGLRGEPLMSHPNRSRQDSGHDRDAAPPYPSASGIAAQVNAGELDPGAVVSAFQARIDARNGELNAVFEERRDLVEADVAQVRARIAAGERPRSPACPSSSRTTSGSRATHRPRLAALPRSRRPARMPLPWRGCGGRCGHHRHRQLPRVRLQGRTTNSSTA